MRLIMVVMSFFLLTGCGLIDEVNQTLDYGKKAKDYVSTMAGYQDDIATYLNKDQITKEDLENLKTMMNDIETEVKAFNDIEPPSVAEGIHGQIESQNEQILGAIDAARSQIESGEFNASAFEELEIVQSLQKLKSFKDQIDNIMQ